MVLKEVPCWESARPVFERETEREDPGVEAKSELVCQLRLRQTKIAISCEHINYYIYIKDIYIYNYNPRLGLLAEKGELEPQNLTPF